MKETKENFKNRWQQQIERLQTLLIGDDIFMSLIKEELKQAYVDGYVKAIEGVRKNIMPDYDSTDKEDIATFISLLEASRVDLKAYYIKDIAERENEESISIQTFKDEYNERYKVVRDISNFIFKLFDIKDL